MADEMLLMLSFPSAFRFRFGNGSGGANTAYADHISHSVHIPMRPCIPRDIVGRG